MALITCPDCGKSISDKAPTCPQCGRAMQAPVQREGCFLQTLNLGCALVGLFVVLIVVILVVAAYSK